MKSSALQRAENSSIAVVDVEIWQADKFQCSSASRKFLNVDVQLSGCVGDRVSVLFSEPKIPQSNFESALFRFQAVFQCSSASRKFLNSTRRSTSTTQRVCVSVLFSEPKIPQYEELEEPLRVSKCFSALQRAENSSITDGDRHQDRQCEFQCSSASRKFLNHYRQRRAGDGRTSFSALQRAENSSIFRA